MLGAQPAALVARATGRWSSTGSKLEQSDVRRVSVDGIVDTSAVLLTLLQDLVGKIGLRERESGMGRPRGSGQAPPLAPVTIRIGDRQTTMDCVVGPAHSEPVVGSTVLAVMDRAASEGTGTVKPGRGVTCATSRATSLRPSGRCANGAAPSPRPTVSLA